MSEVNEQMPSSQEEADALARSRKKVRIGEGGISDTRAVVPRVEDWMCEDALKSPTVMSNDTEPLRKSYKEACSHEYGRGDSDTVDDDEGDWWKDDGWKSRVQVERTEKGPNIIILPDFKERLAKKWKLTLIVRLLGRMVREDYLGHKLQKLWGRNGEVETIEIGSGFFFVRLNNTEDYDFALTGGPWMLFDHYLAVQPWRPDFDPDEEEVTRIAAWVRIPKFPLDYYDEGILHVVGNQIGKVLKVDRNTLLQAKGRFARICIEIDLNSSLLPVIHINGKEKKIVYEGLHLICFLCGKYGHDKDNCSSTNVEKGHTPSASTTVQKVGGGDQSNTVSPDMSNSSKEFGEWMVAPVRRRTLWRTPTVGEMRQHETRRDQRVGLFAHNQGSRFSALKNMAVDGLEPENIHIDARQPIHNISNSQAVTVRNSKSRDQVMGKQKSVGKHGGPKNVQLNHVPPVKPMEAYLGVKHQLSSQDPHKSLASVVNHPVASMEVDHVMVSTQGIPSSALGYNTEVGAPSHLLFLHNGSAGNPIDPGACSRGALSCHEKPLIASDDDVVGMADATGVPLGTSTV